MSRPIILLLFLANVAFAADVTGTWYSTVELSAGSSSPTLSLKQEGDKVTGTYSGTLGDVALSGTVTGDKIEFSFEGDTGGQKLKVTYNGVLKSEKEMEGKVIYGDIGEGTFTARKKE